MDSGWLNLSGRIHGQDDLSAGSFSRIEWKHPVSVGLDVEDESTVATAWFIDDGTRRDKGGGPAPSSDVIRGPTFRLAGYPRTSTVIFARVYSDRAVFIPPEVRACGQIRIRRRACLVHPVGAGRVWERGSVACGSGNGARIPSVPAHVIFPLRCPRPFQRGELRMTSVRQPLAVADEGMVAAVPPGFPATVYFA